MFDRPAQRSSKLPLLHWPLLAILVCAFQFSAMAESVTVRHPEGTVHGYLTLRTEEGHVAAVGDLLQTVRGDRVTSRTVFHFKDGSVDDETAVFLQRQNFQLISDHHIQKGPFFQHPMDVSIEVHTGTVIAKTTGKDGKESVDTEHMQLPPDLANGIVIPIVKNLRANSPEVDVSMIVMVGSKPKLSKLALTSAGESPFLLEGVERRALHYGLKIQLGGVVGAVAPLVGKQPPLIQVWIEGGEVPGFVAEQGPLAQDSPIVTIQQAAPAFPSAEKSETHSTGN